MFHYLHFEHPSTTQKSPCVSIPSCIPPCVHEVTTWCVCQVVPSTRQKSPRISIPPHLSHHTCKVMFGCLCQVVPSTTEKSPHVSIPPCVPPHMCEVTFGCACQIVPSTTQKSLQVSIPPRVHLSCSPPRKNNIFHLAWKKSAKMNYEFRENCNILYRDNSLVSLQRRQGKVFGTPVNICFSRLTAW